MDGVGIAADRETGSIDVLEFSQPSNLSDFASLGLTLSEVKPLLARDHAGCGRSA